MELDKLQDPDLFFIKNCIILFKEIDINSDGNLEFNEFLNFAIEK